MTSTTAPSLAETPHQQPKSTLNPLAWLRKNLFRTPLDGLLTIVVVVIIVTLGIQFFQWMTTQADWTVITVNFRLLMQGTYPIAESWRVAAAVILIMALAGLSWGVWGRVFFSVVVTLSIAVILLLIVPAANRAVLTESGDLGRYVGGQLLPLLDLIRTPILILAISLGAGYAIGRVFRIANRAATSHATLILWIAAIPAIFVLIRGIVPETSGLPLVPTIYWGGLLLTFMLAAVAIVACFPLGILLALGRVSGGALPRKLALKPLWWLNPLQWARVIANWWHGLGNYPVIKLACIIYIEFLRGIPLVVIFFTANRIVPLVFGGEVEIDNVIRAMVALTLFEAAYIAEIVRGGLQALPPGQLEAARALGLNSVQATLLITLPQALRLVIPALVGQFITMFKDTSLVAIVGLLDLLGMAESVTAQAEFTERRREVLVFAALVYFIFSYGMSYAARQLERSGSGRLRRIAN